MFRINFGMFFTKHLKTGENIDKEKLRSAKILGRWRGLAPLVPLLLGP